MPGRKAKFKHQAKLADTFDSPEELLARIYAANDYDETFERKGKKGEITLEGSGLTAKLRVSLDKKGREKTIERIRLFDADGNRLAEGTGLKADVGRFFRELNRALDHLEDHDLDGALHHLDALWGFAPMRFVGSGANDRILGGAGDTVVKAGRGSDQVFGSEGKDRLDGGAGFDSLYFGALDLKPRDAGVKVDLAKNKAVVMGDAQVVKRFDELGGTRGKDKLLGDERGNYIGGGDGNDRLDGRGGDDFVYGGRGDDKVFGGAGADYLDGGENDDKVFGGAGGDFVYGGAGNDMANGGGGDDTVDGGAGRDTVSGGAGDDSVGGGDGADEVSGGAGDDTVDGGAGTDTVEGGRGTDTLTGGAGADEFRLDSRAGADVIVDFEVGEDRIRADAPFAELTFSQVVGATEIRTAEGDLVGTVLGVDAETLNDADNFL